MLWLNHALYGSVIGSGYGAASNLFSVSHINDEPHELRARAVSDAEHRSRWSACWRRWSSTASSAGRRCCCSPPAVVIAIYLLYQPFPEWWYLRFLIPAIVLLLILASAVSVQLLSRAQHGRRDSDRGRDARHCRHARRRRAAGVRAAANGRTVSRDGGAGARSTARQRGADHRVAERQHALSCRPRSRDVGFARSGVARSRDDVAEVERRCSRTSWSSGGRNPTSARAFAANPTIGAPRLAAALRYESAGRGFTIRPIARVTWRARRIPRRTSGSLKWR